MRDLNSGRPIVCIEDSNEDFATISHALRTANVDNPILRYANGRSAYLALSNADQCSWLGDTAFVLLDLNMPGIHGCDLLKAFRKRSDLALTPVIVLSTSSNNDDVKRCYSEGANAYVVKPLTLQDFELTMLALARFWLCTAMLPNVRQLTS